MCRCKPKLKLRIINQNSVSVLTPADPDTPTEQEHTGQRARSRPRTPSRDVLNTAAVVASGELTCELRSDSSPEREQSHTYEGAEPELPDGNKKRKRKPYRPGEQRHLCVSWRLSV